MNEFPQLFEEKVAVDSTPAFFEGETIAPSEVVGIPSGEHNGCADCGEGHVATFLEGDKHFISLLTEEIHALGQKVEDMGGYVAGLARQQQVLTEHQKQVAEQQNWMAQQVQGFIAMVPQVMGGIPGVGKMLGKKMGKLTDGE